MGKSRFTIALLLGKLAEWILRTFVGRGTNKPGSLMLRLCPDALGRFQLPKLTICVTGTNGKTSTSNLITHILRENGLQVVNNSKGSNMAPGLVSALIPAAHLNGEIQADAAVLEVDERSSQYIYKYFTPKLLVCTNLFRDSIKRNGHSEFIFDKINDFLPAETTLLLNGNDAISGMLGDGVNERVFYAVDRTSESTETCPNTVCDAIACPRCGHRLKYLFYHYHHIGAPECSACGFRLPSPTYTATNVDFTNSTFTFRELDGGEVQLPFTAGNLFNVFNVTAAAAACRMANVPLAQIAATVDSLTARTGRFEETRAGDRTVVTMLSKNQNPISVSQSLQYLRRISGPKDVVLIITDSKDRVHGPEDISWLYDTDFDMLADPSVGTVLIGGTRCSDVALRLTLAGVDEQKLRLYPDYNTLAHEIAAQTNPSGTTVICFELYAMPIAERLRRALTEAAVNPASAASAQDQPEGSNEK